MNIGLDDDGLQLSSGVSESNSVLVDFELTAYLSEDVEESEKFLLLGANDKNVTLGDECGARPRRRFVTVEERSVFEAVKTFDSFNENRSIWFDPDDRTHLLQNRDEVHDLGFDRGVLELGDALCSNGREQHLFGRADRRERKFDVGADESLWRRQVNPLRLLGDDRPKGAKGIKVEVNRAIADATAAKVRDERFAQLVQQRAAEQNRDSTRAGVRINLREVSARDF